MELPPVNSGSRFAKYGLVPSRLSFVIAVKTLCFE